LRFSLRLRPLSNRRCCGFLCKPCQLAVALAILILYTVGVILVAVLWPIAAEIIDKLSGFEVCEYAIVGGGVAGLNTAYQLGQLPRTEGGGRSVCLFEAEEVLGGRVLDVLIDDRFVGLGALRVNANQTLVRRLAFDLGIDLQFEPYAVDVTSARQLFDTSTGAVLPAYPAATSIFANDTEDTLYMDFFTPPPSCAAAPFLNYTLPEAANGHVSMNEYLYTAAGESPLVRSF